VNRVTLDVGPTPSTLVLPDRVETLRLENGPITDLLILAMTTTPVVIDLANLDALTSLDGLPGAYSLAIEECDALATLAGSGTSSSPVTAR
jgi:hypothetical protein